MKVKYLLLVLSALYSSVLLEAVSLRLENETTTPLTARVYAADGTLIGEELVQPRSLVQWSEESGRPGYPPQGPSVSLVPMKVKWFCPDGEVYCLSTDEASGARVRTSACYGARDCRDPKKEELK